MIVSDSDIYAVQGVAVIVAVTPVWPNGKEKWTQISKKKKTR